MRKRITLLIAALMLALTMSIGSVAFAAPKGNPHAGGSGHFKGGSQPCKSSDNNPNCPPFGR
jgi:hypothetical protein